jgi:N-6 DNA Methylase
LLYGSLAWEVKRDLNRERDDLERELKLYLSDLGAGAIGIGTDGLRFEAYQLDADQELRLTDSYDVGAAGSPDDTLDWLDAYVFALDGVPPTTERILGGLALTVPSSRPPLSTSSGSGVRWRATRAPLKRDEWERLLEVVYGTQVASDELWLRHTYLVMVARLLAYLAIVERLPQQGQELGALTGELFAPLGLPNLVERDFFTWPALDQVSDAGRRLLRGLANHLGLFAVGSIDEDLLKELYEHMVDPAEREWLGEFYTPDWLADLVLERAGFDAETRMLDPACGSGTFLFAAIRRLRDSGLDGAGLVRRAREHIAGLDVHPLAVTIARANYVLALRPSALMLHSFVQACPGSAGRKVALPLRVQRTARR